MDYFPMKPAVYCTTHIPVTSKSNTILYIGDIMLTQDFISLDTFNSSVSGK